MRIECWDAEWLKEAEIEKKVEVEGRYPFRQKRSREDTRIKESPKVPQHHRHGCLSESQRREKKDNYLDI